MAIGRIYEAQRTHDAMELVEKFGPHAQRVANRRAERADRQGDEDGAMYWAEVADWIDRYAV